MKPTREAADAERCRNCAFWATLFETLSNYQPGTCRRHAPVLVMSTLLTTQTCHPEVPADHWCGDFQRSPAKE